MSGEGDDGYERGGYDRCAEVSPACPVEATVLGYHPNLGASIFFAIAFGLCFAAALFLGIRSKTWTFTVAITLGLGLETAGESATDTATLLHAQAMLCLGRTSLNEEEERKD